MCGYKHVKCELNTCYMFEFRYEQSLIFKSIRKVKGHMPIFYGTSKRKKNNYIALLALIVVRR
uniref:Putative ovule protein n=1 Tax=Solanum chacoense TaxID=4108 RepID=A0A0V0GTB6_SOLCH